MSGGQSFTEMANLRIAESNNYSREDFENPMTWHKKQKLSTDQLTIDPLFDNIYRKSVTLDQYGFRDHPKYIKWKIFGHNIVICYEYVSKGILEKALEIIEDTENLLKSIGNNDSFLKSIKIALDHVTYSMKDHILKLYPVESELKKFVMPINMNNVNRAGLFGIQALFLYYEYGFLCMEKSKYNLLKAISLNGTEAEWYFLIAKILHDASMNTPQFSHYIQRTKEEFEMAIKAVEIGGKVEHKFHLVNSYYRMSKLRIDDDTRNQYINARIKIINETMDRTNDLLLFKLSFSSLSNIPSDQTSNTIEKLLNKLKSSNCGYVHNVIGKYYLHSVKDYEKALFHLKKACDGNSFYGFYDYINTLIKMNDYRIHVPVEKMLVDMLKRFPNPVHQQKILSQIVSYKIITERDIIGALKYIKMLLSIKNIDSLNNILNHKMQFYGKIKTINLLDTLKKELEKIPNDQSTEVKEALNVLESFDLYVSNLLRPKEPDFGSKFSNNELKNIKLKEKQGATCEINIDEGNWRGLKPDSNSIFFKYQK